MVKQKIKVRLTASIETVFESYGSKKKDNIAKRDILRWVRDVLNHDCDFIPLYVNDAEEDCTRKSKISVKME